MPKWSPFSGWKGLPDTNGLTYFAAASMTMKKVLKH
jgi:hypothetical protein